MLTRFSNGDHFAMFTNTKELCCIPKTNIILYVNHTSHGHKEQCGDARGRVNGGWVKMGKRREGETPVIVSIVKIKTNF